MPVNAGKLSNYTSVATNVNYIKVTFFCNATSHYSKVAPRQEILKKNKNKKKHAALSHDHHILCVL